MFVSIKIHDEEEEENDQVGINLPSISFDTLKKKYSSLGFSFLLPPSLSLSLLSSSSFFLLFFFVRPSCVLTMTSINNTTSRWHAQHYIEGKDETTTETGDFFRRLSFDE